MSIRSRCGGTFAAVPVPPATSLITGGESHAQLRCLRRPTGAARTPHTVYVKTLYRIAGRNYCRDHIIKAAVAAGVIVKIKPGSGPGTVLRRGAASGDPSRS